MALSLCPVYLELHQDLGYRSNRHVNSSQESQRQFLISCESGEAHAVGTTKSGEDQYLALLNIRNTPTQALNSSPAQYLMGSRTRTFLPSTKSLVEPRDPHHKMQQIWLNKRRHANSYNHTEHGLPTLRTFAQKFLLDRFLFKLLLWPDNDLLVSEMK